MQVLTRTMPSSWNPPLYLTPVMPAYWYLQFPCQSFLVPGLQKHKQDSLLTRPPETLNVTLFQSVIDPHFPGYLPPKDVVQLALAYSTVYQLGLDQVRWDLQRKLYFTGWAISHCMCVLSLPSVLWYFLLVASLLWPLNIFQGCFTHSNFFCRESSQALSTTRGLWTCVEDSSTLKNLSLT